MAGSIVGKTVTTLNIKISVDEHSRRLEKDSELDEEEVV